MTLSKLSEMCKACPKADKCDHKRMELCALTELPPPQVSMSASQGILMDAAMPLMRERIENPLSPFAYKDELEMELYKALHEPFMLNFGA